METNIKVAIVGAANLINYGSGLTYYALSSVVSNLGYDYALVLPPLASEWGNEKNWPCWKFPPFDEKNIAIRKKNKLQMRKHLNDEFEVYLVGSDQFFRPDIATKIDKYSWLDWVKNNKKKSVYAGSFGYDDLFCSKNEHAEMLYWLSKFDCFSVREKSGVNLCRKEFNIDAEWVLDPVFLCDVKLYDELASKSQISHKGITTYVLDHSQDKEKIVQEIASSMKENIFEMTDFWKRKTECYVEDWVKAIKNSSFVITDSFHGMCFAIIYHKPFIVIKNVWRGATRFHSILELIGLEERLVDSYQDYINRKDSIEPIDWHLVEKKLEVARKKGISWLKQALLPTNFKQLSDYDMMFDLISSYNFFEKFKTKGIKKFWHKLKKYIG